MKVLCKKNLYLHQGSSNDGQEFLGEATSPSGSTTSLVFKAGKRYEISLSTIPLLDDIQLVKAEAVGEDGNVHTLFTSEESSISAFFDFNKGEKWHRLSIFLDAKSFASLEKAMTRHNDPSLNQAVLRAIKCQSFFDEEMIDKGKDFFLRFPDKKNLVQVILPQ